MRSFIMHYCNINLLGCPILYVECTYLNYGNRKNAYINKRNYIVSELLTRFLLSVKSNIILSKKLIKSTNLTESSMYFAAT